MLLSKYGVARHVYIPIVKRAVVDHAVSADWTPAAGDVKISKDGGAAANVTNLPTAIAMGNSTIWDFSLTATEMQAAQIMVTVADSATKTVEDTAFIIETYGHASGQHAFDLGTATVVASSVSALAANVITAASINADAITAAKIADGAIDAATFAAGAISAAAIAADAITDAKVAADVTIASVTGAVGSVTGAVGSVTAGVTVASGGIGSGAHAAAELNAIADALLDRNLATGTDSGTNSTAVRTMRQALRWLRNKVSIAAGTMTVTKEDDSTSSWTAAVTTTAGNPISAVDPT